MTSSVVNGKDIKIKIDDVEIAHATSHTLTVSVEYQDATTRNGYGWAGVLPTIVSWEVSGDGLVAYDDTVSHDELFDYAANRTKIEVTMTTDVYQDVYFYGFGYIVQLDESAPNNQNTTFSYTIKGTGKLNKSTVPIST